MLSDISKNLIKEYYKKKVNQKRFFTRIKSKRKRQRKNY
jgi:hypothetical protein